jgi:hypothetical protein
MNDGDPTYPFLDESACDFLNSRASWLEELERSRCPTA